MGFWDDLLVAAGVSFAEAALDSFSNSQKASETYISFVFNKKEKTEDESSEEFEKLLAKWDEIFQRENLIIDPKESKVVIHYDEAPYLNLGRHDVKLKKVKPADEISLSRYEDNNAILDIYVRYVDEHDKLTDEKYGKNSRHIIRYYPNKNDRETYLVFSFIPQFVDRSEKRYISQNNIEYVYPVFGFLNLEFKSNDRRFHTGIVIGNPNCYFPSNSNSDSYTIKGYEYVNLKALLNAKGKNDVYEHLCNFIHHPYSLSEAEINRRKVEEEHRRLELERKDREKKAEREVTASLLDSL